MRMYINLSSIVLSRGIPVYYWYPKFYKHTLSPIRKDNIVYYHVDVQICGKYRTSENLLVCPNILNFMTAKIMINIITGQ